ncbi:MAG: RNA-directed DNA polymerase [Clostridia bacterium]|nr:RNA-directed DNA polymerase [Clostridia bacterium]
MIVYKSLESVEADLGVSLKTLYAVSNNLQSHYRNVELPKKNGGIRHLCVPDDVLKHIQRRITEVMLVHMPISKYAGAYRYGASVIHNASAHLGKKRILKLDISKFFDSVLYSQVKEYAFPEIIFSEKVRVLLSILCYYKESLPQGAPSSPAISNIIMRQFDEKVGAWCEERSISYTRYCDDMTFSGDFDANDVKKLVERELGKYGFYLNPVKTKTVTSDHRQSVTGIIVNEKLSLPSEYRRKLRQELYYCRRYGVDAHMERIGVSGSAGSYLSRLLGKVNYVLSVRKDDAEMKEYKAWLVAELKK